MGAREMGKYFWEEPTELGDWGLHVLLALLVFALGNKIEKAVPETKRETQKKKKGKRKGEEDNASKTQDFAKQELFNLHELVTKRVCQYSRPCQPLELFPFRGMSIMKPRP